MENIKFQHKCPRWIIEPDDICMRSNGGFKEKHHVCECDLWVCGWLKDRVKRIKHRIIDRLDKEAWEYIIRLGRALKVSLE